MSYLDNLPYPEREKIRKRMRSPEEYERLRDKVKGPEDLEREMEKNAEFAEARLSLESDPQAQEKAKDTVKASVTEQGIEATLEQGTEALAEAIVSSQFDVVVTESNKGEPQIAVAPSGNVAEVFPLKQQLQQQILSSFTPK
jgi:hypothetical protein